MFAYSGFIDWHMVEKGYSAEEFLFAVQYHVVPHLNAYPLPNSILVTSLISEYLAQTKTDLERN